ncbi:MAG: sulfurtransferase [Phycisphaerae bacterium]|nr:sulfurtransferase [Phycisphaerae bacterium]
MNFQTLISVDELKAHLGDPQVAIVDCRFALDDKQAGRRAYLEAHVSGAVYAHLDDDLAAPVIAGRTGRHPLPKIEEFVRRLSQWGIDDRVQVVAYDNAGGAFAARMWWMLRWLGHDAAAVLDGGWKAWVEAGGSIASGNEERPTRHFTARARADRAVATEEVLSQLNDSRLFLVDSRAAERYRGEVEPLDPVAGHIPGAVNLPYGENLAADGRFKSRAELCQRFEKALGPRDAGNVAFYCGSGVTACHNILAFAHAGLGDALLYPGSWSEWVADGTRPVETGEHRSPQGK